MEILNLAQSRWLIENLLSVAQVNRDLLPSEMQTMRRKLEYLQKELSISRKGVSSDEVQVMISIEEMHFRYKLVLVQKHLYICMLTYKVYIT